MTYWKWLKENESLVTIGGSVKQYRHYCPIMDFKIIAYALADILEKKKSVRYIDFLKKLQGTRMSKGKSFTTKGHSYKLGMVTFVLEDLKLVTINHPGSGRKPIRIDRRVPQNKMNQRVDEIISE